MAYHHPEYLVTAAELAATLRDENVRVFDCAVFLAPKGHSYEMTSGRKLFGGITFAHGQGANATLPIGLTLARPSVRPAGRPTA